jgi:hypothetical protein
VAAQAGAAAKPELDAGKANNALWKEKAVLKTPGWLPGSVACSSNGTMMIVGGTAGKVVAFDRATRKEKWRADIEATSLLWRLLRTENRSSPHSLTAYDSSVL